ncbi:NAD(P)/FAD-dependent oxidoreductase [Candidatus Bipolaricaulota bacterium]
MRGSARGAYGLDESSISDVVVVGGGPAGLAAAIGLAEARLAVSMIEVKPAIGTSVACAEGVNQYIEQDTGFQINRHITQEIISSCVHIGRDRTDLPHGFFSGAVIDKRSLLQTLAEQAEVSGARIHRQVRFLRADFSAQHAILHVSDRGRIAQMRARIVIGADGPISLVAQSRLGPRYTQLALMRCAQLVVQNTVIPQAETTQFHFFFMPNNNAGYGWMFPKSTSSANIGVGSFDPSVNVRRTLEELVSSNPLVDQVVRKASKVTLTGGLVPVSGPRDAEQLVSDGVLLAGSAGGIVEPIMGEGIGPALSSGCAAADAVQAALANGGREREHLLPYMPLWRGKTYLGTHKLGEVLDETAKSLPFFYSQVAKAHTRRKPAMALGKLMHRLNKAL